MKASLILPVLCFAVFGCKPATEPADSGSAKVIPPAEIPKGSAPQAATPPPAPVAGGGGGGQTVQILAPGAGTASPVIPPSDLQGGGSAAGSIVKDRAKSVANQASQASPPPDTSGN